MNALLQGYRDAKTPEAAANALAAWLKAEYPDIGTDTILVRHGSENTYSGESEVMWEDGPFEWAVALLGGSTLFAGELGQYGATGPLWVDEKLVEPAGCHGEPGYSFSVGFYSH